MIPTADLQRRISSYAPLSATAQRVLAVLRSPDTAISEIEAIIRLDYGLSADILRTSNAAAFGFRTPVATIGEAVRRLGTRTIARLATAALLHDSIAREARGYEQSAEASWMHSAAVAITCENICTAIGSSKGGELYTVGLLHDIGKALLDPWVSAQQAQLYALVTTREISFERAEQELFGIDHAEAGARIATHWHLPPALIQAVRWHHEPHRAESAQHEVDIVHVADALCLMQGIGIGADAFSYRPSAESVERLGLTSAAIDLVLSQLVESLATIETLISQTGSTPAVGR